MKHLPQRISLVAQAADILRQEIAGRVWVDILPGERELCDFWRDFWGQRTAVQYQVYFGQQ